MFSRRPISPLLHFVLSYFKITDYSKKLLWVPPRPHFAHLIIFKSKFTPLNSQYFMLKKICEFGNQLLNIISALFFPQVWRLKIYDYKNYGCIASVLKNAYQYKNIPFNFDSPDSKFEMTRCLKATMAREWSKKAKASEKIKFWRSFQPSD